MMNRSNHDSFVNVYIENHSPGHSNVVYHRMISRLINEQTAVLPIQTGNEITWMILQKEGKKAEDHTKEIQHFIGRYCHSTAPRKVLFAGEHTPLKKVGAQHFPEGYFVFISPLAVSDKIWDMLSLWIGLDEKRPSITSVDTEHSAFTLRNQFHEQVATEQWKEAFRTLEIIRHGSYVSEENYLFLKMQWLAAQHHWDDIWYSKDYEIIVQMDYIPARIQQILLRSAYTAIALSDLSEDFNKSLVLFTQSRYRLGTLIHKSVSSREESICRIKAYNAYLETDYDGLQRLLNFVQDSASIAIIHFLLDQLSPQSDEPELTLENKVITEFQLQHFDQAYQDLKMSSLTPFKTKYLCKIATMTDSPIVYEEAKFAWDELPSEEQQALLRDPECRADVMLVQARMNSTAIATKEPSSQSVSKSVEVTWHRWFAQFLSEPNDVEQGQALLREMDTTRGGMVWTDSVLTLLAEQFAELAMMPLHGSSRSLLETALSMFLTELMDPTHFPKDTALSLYDYCSELILAHSKKNQASMTYFLKLSEGIVYLDFSLTHPQFERSVAWFDLSPSKMVLPFLQGALELYFDYGIPQQKLVDLWNHWSGTLGDSLITLETVQLTGWYELGRLMGADANLLVRLSQALQKNEEDSVDVLASLPPQKIAIYTLREHTARRAVEKLGLRNPSHRYVICTDDALTAEAKSHVKSADIVVIVTTCLSHAIFYGIQPYLRNNVVYPRSSGTTGILIAVEEYLNNMN
ncbi:DUF2325 domain-containing protein [Paenibacillus sp. 37]|uniref:DUF2325 domain-containing protein n=1 Tax=Paenibacillus sp. 37 TaxID=2607911 RepID=UPI00122E9E3B|nr:DUF2325 domain-containing protein [Paenibacillus sp. 37]